MWFRAKASVGRVAIWEEPPTGDPMAPYDDPVANFDYVRFCSDFLYLSVTDADTVTVNHTLCAGVSGTGYSVGNGAQNTGTTAPIANGQVRVSTIDLVTHGLPYVPQFSVLHQGRIVSAGMVVQTAESRVRRVSAFATSTKICLREVAISSENDLAAVSLDYTVLVFANPDANPAKPFLRIKPDEEICLAWGKVTDSQRVLRRTEPGDATFYIPIDRTIDIKNGAVRNISPIAGTVDYGIYTGNFVDAESVEVSY